MKKSETLKEKRENKKFIKEQLKRYREELTKYTPGSKEYEEIKNSYLDLYRVTYVRDCDKTLEVTKIFAPILTTIGLSFLAYRKNVNYESKDGDVWSFVKDLIKRFL